VFLNSDDVHLAANDKIKLETKSSDRGQLIIAVGTVIGTANRRIELSCYKGAGLLIGRNSAWLGGRATYLAAGRSVNITEGNEAWIPMDKATMETDPYAKLLKPRYDQNYETYQEENNWLSPFTPTFRENIFFTFRSVAEYGTNAATEVQGGTQFAVYQANWAYLASVGSAMIDAKTTVWVDYSIEDTYPWPGYQGAPYKKLDSEVNIEDKATGTPKPRDEVQNRPGLVGSYGFDEYEVIKQPGD
jgi:hypothetical protein